MVLETKIQKMKFNYHKGQFLLCDKERQLHNHRMDEDLTGKKFSLK